MRPIVCAAAGAVALLIAALTQAGCGGPTPVRAGTAPVVRTPVAVIRTVPEDLTQALTLAAEFRPYQEVEVHAKLAGYLKQIRVDVGDHVSRGELLAVLEVPELYQESNEASSARKRSELEVVRAQGDVERAQSAHSFSHLAYQRLAQVIKTRPNLVAQQEIDEAAARDREDEARLSSARAALAAAQEQVAVAAAKLERIRTMLEYTRITAPFAGVVTHRYADTGAMIQAGTASQTQAMPVVRLSENSRLRLVLPVPESAVPRIRIGTPVEVRVTSLSQAFHGVVARFATRVDTDTRTMETEVDVPNPSLVLVPGMYASATLTLDSRHAALALPLEAVTVSGRNTSVLVVKDNRVERRMVALGMETASRVEVVSGLRAGELVVVGNRNQLEPGQIVQPKTITGSTGEGGA